MNDFDIVNGVMIITLTVIMVCFSNDASIAIITIPIGVLSILNGIFKIEDEKYDFFLEELANDEDEDEDDDYGYSDVLGTLREYNKKQKEPKMFDLKEDEVA